MDDKEWDLVVAVHLKGAYEMTKACWPLFRGQKVGGLSLQIHVSE
jgi:multifunctional beta-oxidation protein